MKIEDYNEYYIQGSDHYLIPKDVFDELFDEMSNWREEAKELKKQLEECYCNRTDCSGRIKGSKTYDSLEQKIKTQQKEFINYLENEIKRINPKELDIGELNLRLNDIKFTQYLIYKEILQKYRSIIGGKE